MGYDHGGAGAVVRAEISECPCATPYKPKVSCDLYVPEKNECAALNTLVCAECGKCAFYKSRKKAREDRLASIVARRDRGYHISDTEARMLLQAMKKKTGLGGK